MSTNRSVQEILIRLETKIAFHRERAAFHRDQEELHREQGARHAAELETLTQHFEAFQATAVAAAKLAEPPAPVPNSDDLVGPRPKLTRLVERVLETVAPTESFGHNRVTREVNQRFEGVLRRRVDPGQVSDVLRRMHRLGRIHSIRAGRPHWETLYIKERA